MVIIDFFCTGSCAAIKINSEITRTGNPQFLIADNHRDDYTPFRWFVLRGKDRDKRKNYGCNITVEYLKELWDKQKGICPLSGWNLKLPINASKWLEKSPANASLDRIDNSIRYMKGNVRFVAVMANLARQDFTDDQVIEFCKAVANN